MNEVDDASLARAAAESAARRSYGKLIAYLAARSRDVAAAEDALAEAFASALADWPRNGVPDNPEAWLLTTARRRAIDAVRRKQSAAMGEDHLILVAEELEEAAANPAAIPDRRLALMFACAHPAIEPAIRAPLILQCVLGFDAVAIGSAFLVAPATMGQRLVRSKTKIRAAGIPFRVPEREELALRLEAVLDAIYAVFAEGWSGMDPKRRDLSGEAIWLGRLTVELLPDQAEALGLLALMLHADARRDARRDADGNFVPLTEQEMRLWDDATIADADALLTRAKLIGEIGRYQLEAAVQSAHAARRHLGHSDWPAILMLYDGLLALTGSPVIAVNRAVALAEVQGVAAGLAALDAIGGDKRIAEYQPYWAARAALLARLGDREGADNAYALAIGLESDPAARAFLQKQRAGPGI
ncbi:RNA polymerase sigma factor [Dongia sp.]|uniref:RNA polymerase sigma factor n=1 Tax=Dongia sp. TaxID=1977262 RepID=UPI003752FE68